jgi:hypothetical protein
MTPTANRCFPTSIPALAFDFCADHHRLPSVAGKAVDVSELKFFHGSPTPIGGATRPLGHFVSGTKRAPFQFPAILPIAPSIPRKRAATRGTHFFIPRGWPACRSSGFRLAACCRPSKPAPSGRKSRPTPLNLDAGAPGALACQFRVARAVFAAGVGKTSSCAAQLSNHVVDTSDTCPTACTRR